MVTDNLGYAESELKDQSFSILLNEFAAQQEFKDLFQALIENTNGVEERAGVTLRNRNGAAVGTNIHFSNIIDASSKSRKILAVVTLA